MFIASSFGFGAAALKTTTKFSKGNAASFGFASAAQYDFAINLMKSIHEHCPGLDVTDSPETADYFIRLDRDPAFILTPDKVAIFDRSRTMVFADRRVTMTRTVNSLCKAIAP